MAFTSAVVTHGRTVFGNKKVVIGTYANTGGSTGGDIATGLNRVDICLLTPKGTAVETNAPVVNETMPLSGGDVTIVTDANENGFFLAIGE